MNLSIPHLLPNIRNENHDLLMRHPQSLPKQKRANTLQVLLNVRQRPEANFFILWILGPSVAGPLERLFGDVDEACLFHATFVVIGFNERTTECCRAFHGQFVPFMERGCGFEGSVVGFSGEGWVNYFKPAAWF